MAKKIPTEAISTAAQDASLPAAARNSAAQAGRETQFPAPDPAPAAADHIPPQITGQDLMASFGNLTRIVRQRRLETLARTYPEIATLLKSKVKTPTAEAPRIES